MGKQLTVYLRRYFRKINYKFLNALMREWVAYEFVKFWN